MSEIVADMLEQALKEGVSRHIRSVDLVQPQQTESFFEDWDPGDSIDSAEDAGLDSQEDQHDAVHHVRQALGHLAIKDPEVWGEAVIHETYKLTYEPGAQGTGWHDDKGTGADVALLHSLSGRASFTAQKHDGTHFAEDMTEGSMIAIDTSAPHEASGPSIQDGRREVVGVLVKLKPDKNIDNK